MKLIEARVHGAVVLQ